jgi:hypothetical protein
MLNGGHAMLYDDRRLRFPYLEDRHASDGARRIILGARVNDIVGADDQRLLASEPSRPD